MNNQQIGRMRLEKITTFLFKYKVATTLQLARACEQGRLPSQPAQSRMLTRLKNNGVVTDYMPFGAARKIWYTNNGCSIFSDAGWLDATNGQNITRTQLTHTLAVSSIASQILNETEINPLGIPANEWAAVRDGVTNGSTHLISENEINTSYAQKLEEIGADNMRDVFASTIENGGSVREYMIKAAREYDTDRLFTWRLATSAYAYDPNMKTYLDAEEVLDASQLPKRTTLPGDERVLLADHPIDLGVYVDDGSGRPLTIAVEMELNPKNLKSYITTLASFQSEIGRDMFDRVVWLCTDNKTINLLNKAIKTVGNVNNQIAIKKIVPVQNDKLWIGTEIALKDNINYINERIEANRTTNKSKTGTPANKPATNNRPAAKPATATSKPATKPIESSKPATATHPQAPIKQERKPATTVPKFNYDFLDTDEDGGNKTASKPETSRPTFNMNVINHETANPFNGANR